MRIKRSIATLILSVLVFIAFSQVTTTRDLIIYDITAEWQAFTMYVCGSTPPKTIEEYVTNIDSRPLPPRVEK